MKWKQKYKIGKVLSLAGLMALANACGKDPQPEPEPEPIVPTKEVTIDWNWEDNLGWAPSKDTIMNYVIQDDVKSIFINLIYNDTTSPVSTGFKPRTFHRARDTLQTRIDIDPSKVRGSGNVYVHPSASLPDCYSIDTLGMAREDSIWYTLRGWTVVLFGHNK